MKLFVSFFLLTVCAVYAANVNEEFVARFDNYRVYKLQIKSDLQLNVLKELEKHTDGFLFWNSLEKINDHALIQVPPHKLSELGEIIKEYNFEYELFIENVQKKIDEVQPKNLPKSGMDWTSYHRLGDIHQWMDSLVEKYPSVVTKIIAGESHEGRKLQGVKISYKEGNKGVFVEAGIHAREWISPATATFILNELLTSTDENIRHYAENFDWYFVPNVNPDGYEYSHTSDRMWRKTRKPYGLVCHGADPNRNWAYGWNEGGASPLPCADTYNGPHAFSEIEMKSLSEYFTSVVNERKISLYLAFHSYSQVMLIPFGNTNEHLGNYEEAMEVGAVGVERISQRFGTKYEVGAIPDLMYIASGGSIDWIKGVHDIPLTYVYELRDTGRHGFLLPADQIIPTGQETLDSVMGLLEEIEKRDL